MWYIQTIMTGSRRYLFVSRLAWGLLPSAISGLLCCCFGAGSVLGYLVMKSINLGTSLPNLFDGEWSVAYTNMIVRPLLVFFSNMTVGKIATILLWGCVGLLIYSILSNASAWFRNWRETSRNIQVAGQKVVQHPARKDFWRTTIWRVCLFALFGTLLLFSLPSIWRDLAAVTPNVLMGDLITKRGIITLVILSLKMSFCAHICVVFLRLFLLRVRLFGPVV